MGETVTAQIDLPEIHGRELEGDDAASAAPDVKANYNPVVSQLPGGHRMMWEGGASAIHARRPYAFRFRLQDAAGRAPADMEMYMVMLGHAPFEFTDERVYSRAHA